MASKTVMKSRQVVAAFAAFVVLPAEMASGAPSPDLADREAALSQCVAMRTSGEDRALIVQGIFAAMATSPHIAEFANVSQQRKAAVDKGFARLLTRLVTRDCLELVKPVAAASGEHALEVVGQALSVVAMQQLFQDPKVEKAVADYTGYLSKDDFNLLVDGVEGQSK